MKKKILIIDDEAVFADLVTAALGADCEVVHIEDGSQAAGACREQRPDAIILDATMPRMGGLDVLQNLQADAEAQSIPVVVMTALGRGLETAERLANHKNVHSFVDKMAGIAAYRQHTLAAAGA
jgi:CheY-like chemotaxis protein